MSRGGRIKGGSRKRKKKFRYHVNKKKLHRKIKKLPRIQWSIPYDKTYLDMRNVCRVTAKLELKKNDCCKEIKHAWDRKKSVFRNMEEMGLSVNPNKALKINEHKDEEQMLVDEATSSRRQTKKIKPPKSHVAEELERKASEPQARNPRLPKEVVKYCIYMIENYGEDYKAMARDPVNYYQDTPRQIKRKIGRFKSIPEQWNEYIMSKSGDSDVMTALPSGDNEEI